MVQVMDNSNIQNPYPGLRPFDEKDARFFYGRERHIGDLMNRLKKAHFISVLGESGCGKSSLVKAGLIPALAKGYMDELGVNWHTVEMRPGREPYPNLAYALLSNVMISDLLFPTISAVEMKKELENELKKIGLQLQKSSKQLGKLLEKINWPQNQQLLLLIDQFEELFTYAHDLKNEDDAESFIALILEASKHPNIFVITTMRLEYLKDYSHFSGLAEAINNGIYLTPRLTRKELTEAIIFPARKAKRGANVEDELANHLLNEIEGKQDALPILQHALMRLWEQDEDKVLTYDEFKNLGSLDDFLNDHISTVYQKLESNKQEVARQVFTSLASKTKDGEYIRTEKSLDELLKITVVNKEVLEQVIEEFIKGNRCFLRKIDKQELTGSTVIDITHESLIRQWKSFKKWIDDEYNDEQNFIKLKEKIDEIESENGRKTKLENIEVDNALTVIENIEKNNNYKLQQLESFNKIKNYIIKRNNDIKNKERESLKKEKEKLKREKESALRKQRVKVGFGVILILSIAGFFTFSSYKDIKKQKNEIKIEKINLTDLIEEEKVRNATKGENKTNSKIHSTNISISSTKKPITTPLPSRDVKCLEENTYRELDANTYIELGLDYRYGRNKKQRNIQKAIACYQAAINTDGSPRAMANLAAIYQYGLDTGIPDYQKAAEEYKKAANKGLNRAKYYLAWLYQKGLGVKQDYKKAVKYYQGLKDYRSSKSQLAYLYYEGRGITQDKGKAKIMLKEALSSASSRGDSVGLMYLGYICATETTNNKESSQNKHTDICCDEEKKEICGLDYGKKLLNKALKKPNYNYTAAYFLSKLEEKGSNSWEKVLKKASDHDITEAQWDYYLYLKKQKKSVKALELLQKLEPKGNKIVLFELANSYDKQKKYSKAYEYFLRAAEANNKDPDLKFMNNLDKKTIQDKIIISIDNYLKNREGTSLKKLTASKGNEINSQFYKLLAILYQKGCKVQKEETYICTIEPDEIKAKKFNKLAKEKSSSELNL